MEYGHLCSQNASVVECLFDGGHDMVQETGSNGIEDDPEAAWFFMCQHSRTGPINSARCVLPQHAAPRGFLWNFLTHAGVSVAFLAFGLTVYISHKRQRSTQRQHIKHNNYLSGN